MLRVRTPDEVYAELFHAVQMGRVFADSKAFADAYARSEPARILDAYRASRDQPGFELTSFVAEHFELRDPGLQESETDPRRPVRERIEALWDVLTRGPDQDEDRRRSSLIPLPRPYVVPGGRFREVYYWDSYFTMLGLAAAGRVTLLESMVENFAHLIDQVGFIPNGNRTYYCSRSQPPLFVLMVELLAELKHDPQVVGTYLRQLEKEYEFWMSGSDELGRDDRAVRRVVAVDGGVLNRYWDDSDKPRQESYYEDQQLASRSRRDPSGLYRDVRAACESGWDFSSRWLDDGQSMSSIRTTRVLPVDLNAILFKLESVLAGECRRQHMHERAAHFHACAERRKRLIQSLFYDQQEGFFADLLLPGLTPTGVQSLAAAYPLFLEIATPAQARAVVAKLDASFLRPGGWTTTLNHSHQQWDAPTGWAPLHWVVYSGMKRYGFAREAAEGARRWIGNNLSEYRQSGRLLEKYDVEEIGRFAQGGEYEVQDGFGWTNGVLSRFLAELE